LAVPFPLGSPAVSHGRHGDETHFAVPLPVPPRALPTKSEKSSFGRFVGFLRPNSLGNNARVHPDSIFHGSVIFYNFFDFSNFSYEKIKKIINCRDNFAKLCGDVSLTVIDAHTKFEAIWSTFGLVSRHLKKVV
jgi:hypothetical protein